MRERQKHIDRQTEIHGDRQIERSTDRQTDPERRKERDGYNDVKYCKMQERNAMRIHIIHTSFSPIERKKYNVMGC